MDNINQTYQEATAVAFSPTAMERVQKIIRRYPEGRQKSALIPILHIAQKEFGGWLSVPVMDYVAGILDIKPIEVYEVATFYTMFNMQPVGKYVLEVCRTGPCMVSGSEKILNHIRQVLNISDGETTPDGLFTLKPAECLGACGYAPMMQLGKFYHENLTTQKVDEILELCRQGAVALD